MQHNKLYKKVLWSLLCIGILMNIVAGFHAYKFTHFDRTANAKTRDAAHLSAIQKLKAMLFGVSNPRPENRSTPKENFETVILKSNKNIACWMIRRDSAKGTVILCHGYSGDKSGMLDKAAIFRKLGYQTMLIDFMGSGGSEGIQTTIGYLEAEEVKTAFDYLTAAGEKNIILFGTSMGAAAIMKAQQDYRMEVDALILECPFGTMLKTVQSRFKSMHIPAFPMDRLLVFWGGALNGFNAFSHNPEDYASNIHCPVLLLHGEKDEKVSMQEIHTIFSKLAGPKTIHLYPLAGHENYLTHYQDLWTNDILNFLTLNH